MSWSDTTKAKSDQLNKLDLMCGPLTILITGAEVIGTGDDIKGVIHFKGDNGKPYKPSKTMARIMSWKWGDDESKFIGESMTLFRNPDTRFGKKTTGGIEISHMTGMSDDDRFLVSGGQRGMVSVKIEHLIFKSEKTPEEIEADKLSRANVWSSQAKTEINEITTLDDLHAWHEKNNDTIDALGKYKDVIDPFNKFYETFEQGLQEGDDGFGGSVQ